MHQWGEKDKNGQDICAQIAYIVDFIAEDIYEHCENPDNWPFSAKEKFGTVRIYCRKPEHPKDIRAYRNAYKKAVKKWPKFRDEILSMADWGELLEGHVPGYKHSDYWRNLDA